MYSEGDSMFGYDLLLAGVGVAWPDEEEDGVR